MQLTLFIKHISKPLMIVAVFLIALHFLMKYVYLAHNATHSEPVGWYILFPANYKKNNLYQICLNPINKGRYLKLMGQLGLKTSDACNNGYMPLLKTIVAVGGDEVRITKSGVLVNNHMIPNSKTETIYNSLNLLPLNPGYRRILKSNEYWLYGSNVRSYDSRYFGVVNGSEIGNRAVLIYKEM